MKTLLSLVLALALSLPALAAQTFGKVSDAKAVKVSELLANPDAWVGKVVKVEALITDVCAKRGCWIRLASDKEFQTLRFKVDDGVITFPMTVKGKRAEAEGVFTKIELTHEENIARLKHEAEEKKVPFDPKSVTGGGVVYQIKGQGAVVR
jgi:hypothetical protein